MRSLFLFPLFSLKYSLSSVFNFFVFFLPGIVNEIYVSLAILKQRNCLDKQIGVVNIWFFLISRMNFKLQNQLNLWLFLIFPDLYTNPGHGREQTIFSLLKFVNSGHSSLITSTILLYFCDFVFSFVIQQWLYLSFLTHFILFIISVLF